MNTWRWYMCGLKHGKKNILSTENKPSQKTINNDNNDNNKKNDKTQK